MAKFCGKCGRALEDNAVFCMTCGTQAPSVQNNAGNNVSNNQSVSNPVEKNAKKANKGLIIGLVCGGGALAALALIVVIILVVVFTRPTPEKIATKYVESLFVNQNSTKIVNMMPDEYFEFSSFEEGITKESFEYDLGNYLFEWDMAVYDEYGEYEVEYTVRGVRDVLYDDYDELVEEYAEELSITGIKDAKVVAFDVNILYDDYGYQQIETGEFNVVVIKLGNKWYLEPTQVNSFTDNGLYNEVGFLT